jgi:hypothetical protein
MAARAVLAGRERNLECHEIRASCELGFCQRRRRCGASAGHVQIDAFSSHTMAQREFAAISIGGANNGTCQITAAVATKLN